MAHPLLHLMAVVFAGALAGRVASPARPGSATLKVEPAGDDPYRCHTTDIACTVVRETADGMVIATLRGGAVAVVPVPAPESLPNGAPILD